MAKRHISDKFWFLLGILIISFSANAVEGVLSEPEFMELTLESKEDHITFPSDFEDLFHTPYQNFLRQSDSSLAFRAFAFGSNKLDARLRAEYEIEPAIFGISFMRDEHELLTYDKMHFYTKAVEQISEFPIDGYLNLDYYRKRYSLYYPKVTTGDGKFRMILPFQNDVVAFNLKGFGSYRQTSISNKELGADFRVTHQHHFGTYFGEEVVLRGKYHVQNEGDLPYNKYRLLSSRAGLFLKYGVFMLRVGLKSCGSYDNNLTSPFIEFWIDHHSIRASIAYNEEILSPEYRTLANGRGDIVFPDNLPEAIDRSLNVFGSILLYDRNTMQFSGVFSNTENYSFPIAGNADTLEIATRNINVAKANISIVSDYKFAHNKFSINYDYSRLTEKGAFLPLNPRLVLIDSVKVPIGQKFKVHANIGYQDGVYRELNFPEGTEPDYEESVIFGLGLSYKYKDFEFEACAENLAGDIVDYQGYSYPARLFIGLAYQKNY